MGHGLKSSKGCRGDDIRGHYRGRLLRGLQGDQRVGGSKLGLPPPPSNSDVLEIIGIILRSSYIPIVALLQGGGPT